MEGTITVEIGRLLGERVTFVQDGSGGIAVRLPSGVDVSSLPRGRIVQITGTLADPYANLELRVATPGDVALIGSGGIPRPVDLPTDGLAEAAEGTLARISGDILRVEAGSTGSIAITVSDDRGQGRVFLYAALSIPRSRFAIGQHLTATGIVGQRESASGLGDGYRIWPRGGDDLTTNSPPRPTPTPDPTPRPSAAPTPHGKPTPRPKPSRSPGSGVVPIGSARSGATVTVEGVVTAPGGLLDGDDRRVTIQDDSGAILLRFPDAGRLPKVGSHLRAAGDVGTYYGGLQLEAAEPPVVLGQGRALPVVLRRAPAAGDEWQLVRVTIRIVNVTKSGDTWRAEASLGAGGALPISGLANSGIPSTALVEGRGATITGIVKRAYPTASDQRFAVVPRAPGDIQLGPEPGGGNGGNGGDGGGHGASGESGPSPSGLGGTPGPGDATPDPISGRTPGQGDPSTPLDVRLDAIPGLEGRLVRVAGSLQSADGPLLTLADGNATAIARLVDTSATFEPPLRTGEVLNVTGLVAARDVGGWEIVTRRDDVLRAAALVLASPAEAPTASASPQASALAAASPALGGGDDAGRTLIALLVGSIAALVLLAVGGLVLRASRAGTARAGPRRSEVPGVRGASIARTRLIGSPASADGPRGPHGTTDPVGESRAGHSAGASPPAGNIGQKERAAEAASSTEPAHGSLPALAAISPTRPPVTPAAAPGGTTDRTRKGPA